MDALAQAPRTIARPVPTELAHPVRRLFGESRGVAWGAICIIALVTLLLVRPLGNSFLSWHRTAGLLQERRTEVAKLEQRHQQLTRKVAYYETESFTAEQGRTYGMVVPGETAFVIRELVRPESAAQYAIARLRNATVDHPAALAG